MRESHRRRLLHHFDHAPALPGTGEAKSDLAQSKLQLRHQLAAGFREAIRRFDLDPVIARQQLNLARVEEHSLAEGDGRREGRLAAGLAAVLVRSDEAHHSVLPSLQTVLNRSTARLQSG